MTDGREIMREISELEKELKATNNASRMYTLLNKMKNRYKELIIHHPILTATKNLDNMLWKHCFYKTIEDYKKKIKNLSNAIEKQTVGYDEVVTEEQQTLVKLGTYYNKFLCDSMTFYQDLLLTLEENFKTTEASSLKDELIARLRGIHSCLLYLGDLARYAEINNPNKNKNFSVAEKYYKRASQVFPDSGNPHNQLAVLAAYKFTGEIVEAYTVYQYCRSLLVQFPFNTSFDNLKVVFEKNVATFAKMQARVSIGQHKKGVPDFVARYIYLHGLLFTLIPKDGDTNYKSEIHLTNCWNSINGNLPVLLDELETCVANPDLTDELLVRLLAINLFFVHYRRPNGETDDHVLSTKNQRLYTARESAALFILFTIINRLALITCPVGTERPKKIVITLLLPILSVFSNWGIANPVFFSSILRQPDPSTIGELLATPDILRAESRAKSTVRAAFTNLKEFFTKKPRETNESSGSLTLTACNLASLNQANSKSVTIHQKPLREHIELRGYLPLADYYELAFNYQKASDRFGELMLPEDEGMARTRRIDNLIILADSFLVAAGPIVQRQPNESTSPERKHDYKSKNSKRPDSKQRQPKKNRKPRKNNKKPAPRKLDEGQVKEEDSAEEQNDDASQGEDEMAAANFIDDEESIKSNDNPNGTEVRPDSLDEDFVEEIIVFKPQTFTKPAWQGGSSGDLASLTKDRVNESSADNEKFVLEKEYLDFLKDVHEQNMKATEEMNQKNGGGNILGGLFGAGGSGELSTGKTLFEGSFNMWDSSAFMNPQAVAPNLSDILAAQNRGINYHHTESHSPPPGFEHVHSANSLYNEQLSGDASWFEEKKEGLLDGNQLNSYDWLYTSDNM